MHNFDRKPAILGKFSSKIETLSTHYLLCQKFAVKLNRSGGISGYKDHRCKNTFQKKYFKKRLKR